MRARLFFFLLCWMISAMGFSAEKKEEPQTTITCKGNLEMDYEKNVAFFHEDVRVEDPRMTMTANEMTVYFTGESKTIEKVVAIGDVHFKKDDKTAKAREAVYTALDGKVVLTGDPKVKKGQDVMSGEKITFFRDDRRMTIEPAAKLILYSSGEELNSEDWL